MTGRYVCQRGSDVVKHLGKLWWAQEKPETGVKPKYDAMHGKGGKNIKYSKPIETYIKSKRSATRPKLPGWKEDDRTSSACTAKPPPHPKHAKRIRHGFYKFGSDMNMVNEINIVLRSKFIFKFRFFDLYLTGLNPTLDSNFKPSKILLQKKKTI